MVRATHNYTESTMVKRKEDEFGSFFATDDGEYEFECEEDACTAERLSIVKKSLDRLGITNVLKDTKDQAPNVNLLLWVEMIRNPDYYKDIIIIDDRMRESLLKAIYDHRLIESWANDKEIWRELLAHAHKERTMNCYKGIDDDDECKEKIKIRIEEINHHMGCSLFYRLTNEAVGLKIKGKTSSRVIQSYLDSIEVTKELQRRWCKRLKKYIDCGINYPCGMQLEVTKIYDFRHEGIVPP